MSTLRTFLRDVEKIFRESEPVIYSYPDQIVTVETIAAALVKLRLELTVASERGENAQSRARRDAEAIYWTIEKLAAQAKLRER